MPTTARLFLDVTAPLIPPGCFGIDECDANEEKNHEANSEKSAIRDKYSEITRTYGNNAASESFVL